MKILLLTQKVDRTDGVLGFFHRWIEEFARYAEVVHVVCLSEGEHDLPDNVHVHSLGKEKGTGRLAYLWRFYRYIWTLRHDYDAVFVHMNQIYVVLGGLLWRLWGKRIGLWYMHKSVPITLRLAEKVTHDIFTGTTESFRLPSRKVTVTGHGIDVTAFAPKEAPRDDGLLQIVSIGRLSPVKDYETIIEAIDHLRKRGVEATLTIVGSAGTPEQGAYEADLKEQVRTRGLGEYVSFVGSVAHARIRQYLTEADVFVNMSHTGSLDKAVLEAMATETLVVTCNDPVRAMLGEYQGLLFVEKSDAGGLAERLSRIASLPSSERLKIGSALRTLVVENHNLTHLINHITTKLS